jgi:hypothetical protein
MIVVSDIFKLPTQVYMVDAFSDYAASALAATGVMRSIMGGTLPLAGLPLYSALGYGWVRVFVTHHLWRHYLLKIGQLPPGVHRDCGICCPFGILEVW